jgi:hypothetical protein
MTTVDKITGSILVLAIVVVGVLAGLTDIDGTAALGFISGITVALLTHTTAQVAVNKNDIKNLQQDAVQVAETLKSTTEATTPATDTTPGA